MRAARIPWPPAPQSPLQPLQDNLESQTYETFERDGTKYTTYEEAVYRCLLDRVPQVGGAQRWRAAGWGPRTAGLCTSRHTGEEGMRRGCAAGRPCQQHPVPASPCARPPPSPCPQEEAERRVTVLMVVGAGRGPLVAASLRASVRAKRRLR